jgi:hypothetical protein
MVLKLARVRHSSQTAGMRGVFQPQFLVAFMAIAATALKFWLPILTQPLRTFLGHNFFAENYGNLSIRRFARLSIFFFIFFFLGTVIVCLYLTHIEKIE